ncbi:MAG: glycosyl transferase [Parvibaculum sp.]|mgnify:FL=1|nr:glycosyl transferase [Parvibaculum sp.]|tara:strand:- start:340 stop:1533 length:1194 start_codon:yes stop_codon:yes gene_type:complete
MSTLVPTESLRILHCLRAPVGGLFRHVCDLAEAQYDAGNAVGVLCADEPNDCQTRERIAELEKHCELGVTRIGLGRMPGLSDIKALVATAHKVRDLAPNILHGHGAKGGLLARCTPSSKALARIYTPHGGSIHYAPNSLVGVVFGLAERLMFKCTDGLIFESDFARSVFAQRFGELPVNTQVVHNGLAEYEFARVSVKDDPADFLFLGEIRELKGIFTLLDAVAEIATRRPVTVDVAGDGPDMVAFTADVEARSLTQSVRILGKVPARDAFARARAVVLPSHHDSFPYVALEAAAAGRPLIATSTGGIPEIFGPLANRLIKPGNAQALQQAMEHFLDHESLQLREAGKLRAHVRDHFSLNGMAAGVAAVYRGALLEISEKINEHSATSSPAKLDAAE